MNLLVLVAEQQLNLKRSHTLLSSLKLVGLEGCSSVWGHSVRNTLLCVPLLSERISRCNRAFFGIHFLRKQVWVPPSLQEFDKNILLSRLEGAVGWWL